VIVDDEPHLIQLLSLLLEKRGYVVAGKFQDGSEVARAFEIDNNLADAVLMDSRMPKMDGITAAEIIKSLNAKVKILMLSANDVLPTREKIGLFEQVIRKPVDIRNLVVAIKGAFEE
jgi:CheY-like chemotaxis protein